MSHACNFKFSSNHIKKIKKKKKETDKVNFENIFYFTHHILRGVPAPQVLMAQRVTDETFYIVLIQCRNVGCVLHCSTSQSGQPYFRCPLGTCDQRSRIGQCRPRDKVVFSSCKEAVPFIKTNRKSLEGILPCLRAEASAVGTFVFIKSFAPPSLLELL